MNWWLEQAGELAAMAVGFPLMGMLVVVGGYPVGQLLVSDNTPALTKYGLLFGLGAVVWVIRYGLLHGGLGVENPW